MSELSRSAGERHRSLTGGESQNDMAKGGVVAWARWLERYVAVENGRTGGARINDLRAGFDLPDVRRSDGAEATCKARELRALLRYMKLSASR